MFINLWNHGRPHADRVRVGTAENSQGEKHMLLSAFRQTDGFRTYEPLRRSQGSRSAH